MRRVLLIVLGACAIIDSQSVQGSDDITDLIKDTENRVLKKLNSSVSENSTVDTCGGIFSQPQFLIETPNYPSNYQNNLDCLFIFKGPYCETNYTLQFLDFNVEDTLGCYADRLEVKYKDALCGIHEGMKNYATATGILELNFVSSANVSARGFRILVTRSSCLPGNTKNRTEQSPPQTTATPQTIPPNNYPPVIPDSINPYPSALPNHPYLPPYPPAGAPPKNPYGQACCASTYSSKRFYLSSRGFPYSHNDPAECTFTVYKSNPKVCRIRIHFHFFWIGEQDDICTKGYLQIDGKPICGCRTGMKLLSPFDASFGNTKVFRYKNVGIPRSMFSGFAIEVIQDECPERYSPTDVKDVRMLNFYNDQIDRPAWPNMSHEDFLLRAQAINDNTEIFEPIDLGFKPRVVKHVYYFDSPSFFDDYDIGYTFNKPREIEETTYVDTSDLNILYPNAYESSRCRLWGLLQWTLLNKDPLWQHMPKCNDIANHHVKSNCKEYNFIKGYFQSPGYPHYYPKNLDVCYRFSKQTGFCKIRLMMLDFQVDESYDCNKDYLLINKNIRYCGQSLANTFTLFDMHGKNYEEIRFVTDRQSSGRGFRGIYEQIPCVGGVHPPHVHTTRPTPPYIPPPLPPTTTEYPQRSCSRMINDPYFTIDIYDYGKDNCDFIIRKSSQNTCRLELTLVTFDLSCDIEYLVIKGERFCGRLSGRMLSFDFDGNELVMMYKRIAPRMMVGRGLKMHLAGRQFDCEVQIPPAQRVLQADRRTDMQHVEGNSTLRMEIVKDGDETTAILRKKYDEVCGVVMNLKAPKATDDSICKLLVNVKDCSPISERAVYVPYNNSDKLELKFKNAETVQDVEFKEITCDNKFIL